MKLNVLAEGIIWKNPYPGSRSLRPWHDFCQKGMAPPTMGLSSSLPSSTQMR